MVRNGDVSWSDVTRILRRFWWVPVTSIIVCLGMAAASLVVLPKRYTSQTMILVEQPTVPTDYVKPVISEDLNHRLASMQEQILSRTRLQPIIEKFGLDRRHPSEIYGEDIVIWLRKAIKITPIQSMPGTENRQLPGFYVNVEFNDPRLAQQICSEITSMFLEQNALEREQQASRTTSFLTQELDGAKAKLDEQDAKLAQFKRQYLGSLPEEEQANLSLLTSMNSQLEANLQALGRAEQDKAFNESLLNQQQQDHQDRQVSETGINPGKDELELSALRQQLIALLAHYTPKHPDVVKVKNHIQELEKRQTENLRVAAEASMASGARMSVSPQAQQLLAKIRQGEIIITDLTRRQTQIQEQIHQLEGRVQASPVVEQRYKELTRNYQTAQDFYNDLLKKRENSEMATNLEHQQESEQFRVLDPPSLPDRPSFPNTFAFLGGGLGAGLALGLGVLYLIAYTDTSLHTEGDVEKCLNLPVLALIPTLDFEVEQTEVGSRVA